MPEEIKFDPPRRQGFYLAQMADGTWLVAEWRQRDAKIGKAWYVHKGETPCSDKVPHLVTGVRGFKPATPVQVQAALAREKTTQERIQAAYRNALSRRELGAPPTPPPASRRLEVGDEVLMGALRNCRVEALFENDTVVVLSYDEYPTSRNGLKAVMREYMGTRWTSVLKRRTDWPEPMGRDPVMFGGYSNADVSSLLFMMDQGLNDSPDYQRGYAWTTTDQERYLASAFEGRELGRFIFVRKGFPALDEVLDGKQRLNCLWQFYTSQISYRGLFWHELSPVDRNRFLGRSVQWATLPGDRYTRADLLQIFLEVNASGVPQSEEHLEHVRQLLKQEEAKSTSATS